MAKRKKSKALINYALFCWDKRKEPSGRSSYLGVFSHIVMRPQPGSTIMVGDHVDKTFTPIPMFWYIINVELPAREINCKVSFKVKEGAGGAMKMETSLPNLELPAAKKVTRHTLEIGVQNIWINLGDGLLTFETYLDRKFTHAIDLPTSVIIPQY